jgi:hypothetical protein
MRAERLAARGEKIMVRNGRDQWPQFLKNWNQQIDVLDAISGHQVHGFFISLGHLTPERPAAVFHLVVLKQEF